MKRRLKGTNRKTCAIIKNKKCPKNEANNLQHSKLWKIEASRLILSSSFQRIVQITRLWLWSNGLRLWLFRCGICSCLQNCALWTPLGENFARSWSGFLVFSSHVRYMIRMDINRESKLTSLVDILYGVQAHLSCWRSEHDQVPKRNVSKAVLDGGKDRRWHTSMIEHKGSHAQDL